VVVDDSLGFDTTELLLEIAASPAAGGRVRVYRRESTGCIGASKAAAAGLCRGEILLELDHDDELLPDAVGTIAAAFRLDPETDFVYSDWIDVVDDGDQQLPVKLYPYGWGLGFGAYATEVIGGCRCPVAIAPPITWETVRHIVSMPNHLRAWRATAYFRIGGFDQRLTTGDDYDLLVRTFLCCSMARIPRPLYIQHHGLSDRSASRQRNRYIQEVVGMVAQQREHDLDDRCFELGAFPNSTNPLTADATLYAANTLVDPAQLAHKDPHESLISIILPIRDRSEKLVPAIESLLGQSRSNLELLIVSEDSPQIDAVIATQVDPRIRHAILPERWENSTAARNFALRAMARSDLTVVMDGHTSSRPARLEHLLNRVAKKQDSPSSNRHRLTGMRHRLTGTATRSGYIKRNEVRTALRRPAGSSRFFGRGSEMARQRSRKAVRRVDWLRGRPWLDITLPDRIRGYPGMLEEDERKLLYALGRSHQGVGQIVDAGCFLGCSTMAFARGLEANPSRRAEPETIHSYDLFRLDSFTKMAFADLVTDVGVGGSFRTKFDQLLGADTRCVAVHEGDVRNFQWSGNPVELLFIDIAKSWEINQHVIEQFFPALVPDQSVVVHQDFVHEWLPHIHVTMGYLGDAFEFAGVVGTSGLFVPRRRIRRSEIPLLKTALSDNEKLDCFDRACTDAEGEARLLLDCARATLLHELGKHSEVLRTLESIQSRFVEEAKLPPAEFGSCLLRRHPHPAISVPAAERWFAATIADPTVHGIDPAEKRDEVLVERGFDEP
jgi:hypothetical protein